MMLFFQRGTQCADGVARNVALLLKRLLVLFEASREDIAGFGDAEIIFPIARDLADLEIVITGPFLSGQS